MSEPVRFHFDVAGGNFASAGEASATVKKLLRQLGIDSSVIRRISIAMYEGEINMVIHASGGTAEVVIDEEKLVITLQDVGPGIPNLSQAMQEGWSTASPEVRGMGFGAGMGLPNMDRNADRMEVTSVPGQGTRVVMEIDLPAKEAAT